MKRYLPILIALSLLAGNNAWGESALKHRYSFNEANNGLVPDSNGSANARLHGDASICTVKDVTDKEHSVLRLTGKGNSRKIAESSCASLPSDLVKFGAYESFSVETWATLTVDKGDWMRLFDFGSAGFDADGNLDSGINYFILTWHSPNGTLCASDKLNGAEYRVEGSKLPVNDGIFHHIVYTYNGKTHEGTLYADGIQTGRNTQQPTPKDYGDSFSNLLIGKSLWPNDAPFVGDIDEFRIYNGVLSSKQVALNYKLGPDFIGDDLKLEDFKLGMDKTTLNWGDTLHVQATAVYERIGDLDVSADVSINSFDSQILAKTSDGRIRAIAPGKTTVTVCYEGKEYAKEITVLDTCKNSNFYATYAPDYQTEWAPSEWPIIKHYDQNHLYQVSLPLGGIGTGTVGLGGRGELRDWEIMNIPGKKFSSIAKGNDAPFFAIYVKPKNKPASTTLLAGPLYSHEYLHAEGRPTDHHGLPRFREASFDAAYPFGQVHLNDKDLPIQVIIKGFNPLVPGDEDASSLPIAVLSYEVTNETDQPMDVSVCGSIRNFIGRDGSNFGFDWKGDYIPYGVKDNENLFRQEKNLQGIYFFSHGVATNDTAWGTMALTTQAKEGVTYRTSSRNNAWSNSMLSFWDDFSEDGKLVERYHKVENDPMASLAVSKQIKPHGKEHFTFYLTWNFPNRKSWSSSIVGNYYSGLYLDAWEAAEKLVPRIGSLEKKTLQFVNAFASSSYPDAIKEAALFNLATLRSQTVFRLPSGHLMGWEGVMDRNGSCAGSCTHVWNYELATPFLFGKLARTMRDVEFNYSTHPDGMMNFRTHLPLSERPRAGAAADGQMGCIMKFYRDWQLSGNQDFLKTNWVQVKKALSYAWAKRGWDGNQDGVMEGSQHNTMDVNYFGPNPQMGFWYMGALRAAQEMAEYLGDKEFATKCKDLFQKGSSWMDANLFNGEYYEHCLTDPSTFEYLDMKDPNVKIPDYQLYKGCLVDQLVGQYMADVCDLGYLAKPENIKTTLRSIMKNNFVPDFSRHFNNMRSYVMGDEAGLLMASWPHGRLVVPFPYFPEVMTGFEYSAAVAMIYEGMNDDALTCITAIRDRHDGAKRNPFSEPECGHCYARSMASWGAIPAWSGFHFSGVTKEMTFANKPGIWFWSTGESWGICEIKDGKAALNTLFGKEKMQGVEVTIRE